jgi:cysteine desulfurase
MIYLDNNATTRPFPKVVEAMVPYLSDCFLNPAASTAAFTSAGVPREAAAMELAKLFNAEGTECFTFTSGATESNNWVFSSILKTYRAGSVLISTVEHPSVSEPAAELARNGIKVIEIPVDERGVINLEALKAALSQETVMVSVMAANNETGVLQPLKEIGEIIRIKSPSAIFHTDAAQAVGKIHIDLCNDWQNIDLMTFSAHKFHGPKGIGGLYIRPGIEITPLLLGGGQEEGRRSGTTNTPALAGLAAAVVELNDHGLESTSVLRNQFEAELRMCFPKVQIHGDGAARLPNTCCFSLPGVIGDDLAISLAMRDVIVGTGSACSSGTIQPSKTLLAMKVAHDTAKAALRISLDQSTTASHISKFFECLSDILSASSIPVELPVK